MKPVWLERLEKADVICSHCHNSFNDSKENWRFTGFHWEHKCKDSELKYFIGVSRKQLEKERKRFKTLKGE